MAHITSAPRIFVDLDGVLADFNQGAKEMLGLITSRDKEPIGLWRAINHHGNFFARLPPMPEMRRLWDGIRQLDPYPIVLTGIPMGRGICEQKEEWVRTHLGPDVQVICTPSRLKAAQAHPGDILLDDWLKYKDNWVNAGGIFIQYVDVDQALSDLEYVLSVR